MQTAVSELVGQAGHVPVLASVDIDFNILFVAQMVVFAALILILKPLLFDPVLKVFEERENRTDGAKAEARKMQEQAGELLRRYETELERVNRVAAQERDKIRTETARLEAEILAEARTSSRTIIDDGRQRIQREVDRIRFDLGRQAERIARDVASRALGREVN